MTYELFVQNQLKYTSHSLEWLPISHVDPVNQLFDYQYFLLGTHIEREDGQEHANQEADQLQLARLRTPNRKLHTDEVEELARTPGLQKDLSRLEIIREIPHEEEVIKVRSMPHNLSIVASMTNAGLINLYTLPEISQI